MLPKKVTFILSLLTSAHSYSQSISQDDIIKNKIKSVTQKSWNEGLLYSTQERKYTMEGKIEEDSYTHFNPETGITNTSKNQYVYKDNHIIRTLHYANDDLSSSTSHHVKWDGSNWTFTDTIYLPSSGKISVRRNSKTEDSTRIYYNTKAFTNDSIQSEENRIVYKLNDSSKITVETIDYYYKGIKRTYQCDSTIQINTNHTSKSVSFENGKFLRSFTNEFRDSICYYTRQEEYDFSGRHKIIQETWFDENGDPVKKIKSSNGKSIFHYATQTSHRKGMKIEEKITYKGKRKVIEKTRSESDSRGLPEQILYYDKNDNLTGKIIWEYTYW